MSEKPPQNRRENLLVSMIFNVLVPVVLLKKGDDLLIAVASLSKDDAQLGAFIIALAFPTVYFVYDWQRRHRANFISILGFVSVLLTGGIGLLQLSHTWFIVKEGGLPLIIGIIILLTVKTRNPLVKVLLYNDAIFNVDLIDQKLEEQNNRRSFNDLTRSCTYLIAASLFLSSIIQFILASYIVTVDPEENLDLFSDQVGTMTWVSMVVISILTLPITGYALWKLIKGIEALTELKFEEMMHGDVAAKLEESQKSED